MKKGFCLLLALVLCICCVPVMADGDDSYNDGLKYMKQELYYSAYLAFLNSSDSRAPEMAERCKQPWPKTKELWHDNTLKNEKMELTIKVNQDKDQAFFARIYKNGKAVSYVFIGGTGSVTVRLPGAKYSIKRGFGHDWYGVKEAFGRAGSYSNMLFNGDSEEIYLQQNNGYILTVNATESTGGKTVNSEGINWGEFMD